MHPSASGAGSRMGTVSCAVAEFFPEAGKPFSLGIHHAKRQLISMADHQFDLTSEERVHG